jgi:O-antigen/teichoic acid export membrane protein
MSVAPAPPRSDAARRLSAVGIHQIAQVVGGMAFAALIPRHYGPDVYGQFAFVFALINVFQMIGESGYQEIFSRYLPEIRAQAGELAARAAAWQLLLFKATFGLVVGTLALGSSAWLAEWLTGWDLVWITVAVTVRVWISGPFPLLLGLGQTAKWAIENTWRQLVLLGLIVLVVPARTLTSALLALAMHEILFLLLGLWWARAWIFGQRPASDALPAQYGLGVLLRFGLSFALANLGFVALFRVSPVLVGEFTGSSVETGYFDLSLGALLLIFLFLTSVAYAFIPLLTQLRLAQRAEAEIDLWLGRFVRYGGVLVAIVAGGIWAVAEGLAGTVLGEGFAPAAGAFRGAAIGLVPTPVVLAATLISTVDKRPLDKLWASLFGLAAFGAFAWVWRDSGAATLAYGFVIALAASAVGFGPSTWRVVRAAGWGGLKALAPLIAYLPVALWPQANLLLGLGQWALLTIPAVGLAFVLRAISLAEARAIRHQ